MKRATLTSALVATTAVTAALGVTVVTPAAQATSAASVGWTRSADHTMHHACHSYPFRYAVKAPAQKWSAELRLVGPHGGHVASDFFLNGDNPRSGVSHWKVCGSTWSAGRYTIKMSVTSFAADTGNATTRKAANSTFRLLPR